MKICWDCGKEYSLPESHFELIKEKFNIGTCELCGKPRHIVQWPKQFLNEISQLLVDDMAKLLHQRVHYKGQDEYDDIIQNKYNKKPARLRKRA